MLISIFVSSSLSLSVFLSDMNVDNDSELETNMLICGARDSSYRVPHN
jgi:hypothetical protein